MLDELFDSEELPNEMIYRAAQGLVKRLMDREHKKIEWVANEIGTTKGYLYASLDPRQMHKPLSVDRAVALTRLSGDMSIIEEMAKMFGYALCKAEAREQEYRDISDIVDSALSLQCGQGELSKSIKEAIEDGVIDEKEKQMIKTKAYELRKLAIELESLIDSIKDK